MVEGGEVQRLVQIPAYIPPYLKGPGWHWNEGRGGYGRSDGQPKMNLDTYEFEHRAALVGQGARKWGAEPARGQQSWAQQNSVAFMRPPRCSARRVYRRLLAEI